MVERIAGWSTRHRKIAVFGWLGLVVAIFALSQLMGSRQLQTYDPGQTGQGERALHQIAPADLNKLQESVLVQGHPGTAPFARNDQLQQATREVVAALGALPRDAGTIQSPLTTGNASLVSSDGRSVVVRFLVPSTGGSADQAVAADERAVAAVQARNPSLTIKEAGDASVAKAIDDSLNFRQAEVTSIPVTLILLVIVFGALVAAGIPVLLAVSAVTAALALVTIGSHWLPVSSSTSEVVLIVGMAVGVDDSLFYLRREREERARGRSFPEALRIAAGTSGRAILVSGVTVMIALGGLFLTGIDLFDGMALGTIAVVGIAVAGSLTVLPALLSWLGPRADRGRVPFLGRGRAAGQPSRLWAALVQRVVRHPLVWGGVAMIALLALATPALGMRLGEPAVDAPRNAPVIQTLNQIQHAFPQAPAPATVIVTGAGVTSSRMSAAVTALQGRAEAGGSIREPVTATPIGSNATGRGLAINVPLAGNGSDARSNQALQTLRTDILPATIGKVHGVTFSVIGDTAMNYDFTHQLHNRTPIVLGLVAALAFVLLLFAFRSLAIPLVSIVLNLLSVGAAYGLVTLIFQGGRLQGLLGYTSFGGIISWVPLFMFVFLFGISMDYHVFILSRIRELRAGGATTRDATTRGIASSAGVVTSAALIMVAVFSIFATLPLIDLKILGIGTAAAVLIDATIVRGILVPAALALLGERTWYLPQWLNHLLPSRASSLPPADPSSPPAGPPLPPGDQSTLTPA
jgi:RND superfamily putative drug exporter